MTSGALNLEDALVALGRPGEFPEKPRLSPGPLLGALRRAGTEHLYADTASRDELADLVRQEDGSLRAEIDGNTLNQPLMRKVLEQELDRIDLASWAEAIRPQARAKDPEALAPLLYTALSGNVANRIAAAFAAGRSWEVSLQLHMDLVTAPDRARAMGRLLRRMAPTAFVKVPFAPHAPACFLVARDLEREGVPVNFTSTFSARQAVAAALLADVTRTNVFMGRLDQGLESERVGAHVVLEAQRALRDLRQRRGLKTRLIVASMREWQSFVRTAGCDCYTAPCSVIQDLVDQEEMGPEEITSQLETSYEDRLGIPDALLERLGRDRIARLWRVEPELVGFLSEYRGTREYAELRDGDTLARRLEQSGFGDLLHTPDEAGWKQIHRGKIPDPDESLVQVVALDTLYSLHADADFASHQTAMDREVVRRLR